MPRIALIHATPVAMEPVREAFERGWPEAFTTNLLEDSLSPDLAAAGRIDDAMFRRFEALGRYAADTGADAILFTCSAFGPAIDAVANVLDPLPVLKPNEAMFEAAVETGKRVGMLATFEPSIPPMEDEFAAAAEEDGALRTIRVEGAMDALLAGDAERHHQLIAEAADGLSDCDVVMLAHFSTADARSHVEAVLDCPVLTSPDSAVDKLKSVLA